MASTSFEAALAAILREEGGYADHPADPGGATMMGITQATLAQWRGRPVTKAEVQALSRAEVAAIYRARYWDAVEGDSLPAGLDLALFDLAVNSGPSRAIRLLQRALDVAEDGVIGPVTRAAITRQAPMAIIASLSQARRDFLANLPTVAVFGRGWQRRVTAIEAQAKAIAQATHRSDPTPHKETTMEDVKPFYLSKTVWVNLIGLGAIVLSVFGISTTGIDSSALADSILQAIAAGSFIASSIFRLVATKRLA